MASETILVQAPDPPAWLSAAGRWLWQRDLSFRCTVAQARGIYLRQILNREAQRRWAEWYNG